MKTVVIAMARGNFLKEVKRELKRDCRVLTAERGVSLAAVLDGENPEVQVLDLHLPGLDPIDFFRQRKRAFRVLAVTGFISAFLMEHLAGLGISYLLVRPCLAETVVRRTRELLEPAVGERGRLRYLLERFSIPTDILGGQCLLLAIPLWEDAVHRSLTGKLYPQVGKALGMDWSLVERNIRYAVAKGWKVGSRELWQRYFPRGKPTNGEFIAAMARLDRGTSPDWGIEQGICG